MRALRALLLVVPLAWGAAQACASGEESTGAGGGGGTDAGKDQSTDGTGGGGQAGAGGGTGATGGTATGGTTGTGATGGTGGAAGAGGTGGGPTTTCVECPAKPCGLGEVCTALTNGTDAGAAGAGGAAGSGAGDASAPDGGGGPKSVCLPLCNLASPSCPSGFTCQAGSGGSAVCFPNQPAECKVEQPNGTECTKDSQCSSGHCANGYCCASGVCCLTSAECTGTSVSCTDPANCQGTRTGQICQANQCVAGTEDDDSACDSNVVAKACGTYPSQKCTGAADQVAPSCATTCSANSECIAPAQCQLGHCCAPGTFDFDTDPSTCECTSTPATGQGVTCANAIDLGNISDAGQTVSIKANLLPNREAWYKFHAVDTADTACDKFDVHLKFLTNPGNGYEFSVFRGDCATESCAADTEYNWNTNFRATVGGKLAGQCPCVASGAPKQANVSVCEDDSADFFVRVRMVTSFTPTSCAEFDLQVTNGL